MEIYWNSSWAKIDPDRLARYIKTFDTSPDDMIEYLQSQHVSTVCDAGCGCGIYSLKLAAQGFSVSGFDVSGHAVEIAKKLLDTAAAKAELKTASILCTGYQSNQFDAVISRDVIDHMCKSDGITAVQELYRIIRPGGTIFITLDHSDDEYESEPHTVNTDGDFLFTDGKWKGMIFHPYTEAEISQLIPVNAQFHLATVDDGYILRINKPH